MSTQKSPIKGYRTLTDDETKLINEGKELAEKVGEFVIRLEQLSDPAIEPDYRWLAVGKTDLQKGFMAVIRSIAKPTTF